MRLSLRALADELGVSVATVSRALRGLACVDVETRRRVNEAAARLGYVRDPLLASALTFVRRPDKPVFRETMAFLSSVDAREHTKLPWLARIYAGAAERAAELGYGIESRRIPAQAGEQRLLGRQLVARGIRGCVVCPVNPVTERTPLTLHMDWRRLAGIEIGHSLFTPALPRVGRNLGDDCIVFINKLQSLGFRNLGLALRRSDEETRRWAVLSACLLLKEQQPGIRVHSLFKDGAEFTRAGLVGWLKRRRPQVLIVNGPEVHDWLIAEGWRMPEDISLCRIDCVEGRPESGLRVSYEAIGSAAVSQLASMLERGELGPSGGAGDAARVEPLRPVLSIPSTWHDGTTLRGIR